MTLRGLILQWAHQAGKPKERGHPGPCMVAKTSPWSPLRVNWGSMACSWRCHEVSKAVHEKISS